MDSGENAELIVKKIIIIVVGLIVLLGRAGGGLFAMHMELFTSPILRDDTTGAINLADLKKRVLRLIRGMVA